MSLTELISPQYLIRVTGRKKILGLKFITISKEHLVCCADHKKLPVADFNVWLENKGEELARDKDGLLPLKSGWYGVALIFSK